MLATTMYSELQRRSDFRPVEDNTDISSAQFNPWAEGVSLDGWLPPILLGLSVESLIYGMHCILFVLCVRTLLPRRRRGRPRSKMQLLMIIAVTIMFILATADVAVSWNIMLRHTEWLYVGDSRKFVKAIYPKFLFNLVNSFIADILLIIRCYVVWGKRKIVIIGSGLLLAFGTAMGILSEATTSPALKKYIGLYIFPILALNVGLTILTTARIFWIARGVRQIMGPKMVSHYHFAIGILVESGLLYTVSTLLIIILAPTKFLIMAAAISIRVVCIMPILIIVQIALGQSTGDVQTTVAMMQAGVGTKSQVEVVLDTIVSTGRYDLEEANTDEEGREEPRKSKADERPATFDNGNHIATEKR